MTISSDDYIFLSRYLEASSGIELGPDRRYLIETRLERVAERFGEDGISGIVSRLKFPTDDLLRDAVIEAFCTYDSGFFRDTTPFIFLREQFLPRVLRSDPGRRKIRIWSAGCSIGQEAYSIAIVLQEMRHLLGNREVEILASDISKDCLQRAQEGVFSARDAQLGMPADLLSKYFMQSGDTWQVNDLLRRNITFRKVNLAESFDDLGTFDLIFCRYVLVYFSPEPRKKALERLSARLDPGGYLIMGGTESLAGVTQTFRQADGLPVSVYQRNGLGNELVLEGA